MGKGLGVTDAFTRNEEVKTEGDPDTGVTLRPYTELFKREFPYYLSIGMTTKEYWEEDSELVVAYREAERLRKERANSEAHLQAFYIYEVIADFVPVLVSFPKKGAKPTAFRSEPIDLELRPKAEEKPKTPEDVQKENMAHIKAKMFAFMGRREKQKEDKYNADNRQSLNKVTNECEASGRGIKRTRFGFSKR